MSKFPLVWYPKEGAEDVITQIICTDNATVERLDIKKYAANAKQVLAGPVVKNGERLTAYVIDSANDGSIPHLEGLKEDGTMTFTFSAPTGPTPKAGLYFLNLMKTPLDKQPALAAAINAYLRGIFYCPDHKPVFHHIAQAREDPEILISFQGWPDEEEGWKYWNHKNHWDFAPAIMPHILQEIVGKFESALVPAKL